MWGRNAAVIGIATLIAAVAFTGSPASATVPSPKKVTITSGPTVNTDNSVSLGYSINRWPRAIRSRICTVDTDNTHKLVSCGALTRPAANPTTAQVTLTGLADGTYTFTVTVRFKDGRRAAATSAPFTINTFTDPVGSCWDSTDPAADNFDLLYHGPINTLGNSTVYDSYAGTCSAALSGARTIVRAPDANAATEVCPSLDGHVAFGNLNALGYAAPADFWMCEVTLTALP